MEFELQLNPDNLKNKKFVAQDKKGNTMWEVPADKGLIEYQRNCYFGPKSASESN
jgi:hypothetical protein